MSEVLQQPSQHYQCRSGCPVPNQRYEWQTSVCCTIVCHVVLHLLSSCSLLYPGLFMHQLCAAISTIEHVHMTLPAVCSLGACLYAMQGRHNHSWRYFYSLGLSLCSMHARKMLAAASNSNGPWMLLGATVTTAEPSVIMIDVRVDRHFLPLSPSRVHASCSQQCATRLHFVML